MLNFLSRILGKTYQHLNIIEISRSKLVSNLKYLESLSPKLQIAPVLKSNAYGHGLVEIARIIDDLNTPFLCVDSLHEAYNLKRSGIKTLILIMGYINPENLKVKKVPFSYAIYNLEVAQTINKYQPGASVHIKVDTGMNRLGVKISDLDNLITQVKQLPNLKICGLMSHFASAKSTLDPIFVKQVREYQKALKIIKKHHIELKWKHIGATEAILNPETRKVISRFTNLVRAGKALYGYSTNTQDQHLQPVLTLKTHIAQIKSLQRGDQVGYDGTFTAKHKMTIAILPIGYNDGVDRRLSNKGFMTINDIKCPIIGRVSMNITTIDITKVPNPKINQEVVAVSNIVSWASDCDTIAHELLIHLDSTTKRIII